MCKTSPGLRCSFHARIALENIEAKTQEDPSPANLKKLATAQYNYNATPEGIKKLVDSGNKLDADHFIAVRQQQEATYKEAVELKAKKAKAHSDYLNSPEGIRELRQSGDHELADKLEARLHASIAPSVTKTEAKAPNMEQIDSPTMASLVTIGMLHGALAGFQSGKLSTAVTAGVQAGRKQANDVSSAQQSQSRQLEAFDREMERERVARERDFEKWNKQLDAETSRYMKAHAHMAT